MEKKNLDWGSLAFGYTPTEARFVSNYKNSSWSKGEISADLNIVVNESSGVFQYAQTCFEGLKAYTTEKGKIVLFRPELNAQRMADTCKRLMMPVYPEDKFVEAVVEVVKANAAYVPPYGYGATLYIRPFLIATGPVLGVAPSAEYQFRVFCCPVGPYFKGGAKPIKLRVTTYDRAAPNGTGHIKGGLNYGMSLYAGCEAKAEGYADNLYLDAKTHTYVEETSGANCIFVTKDNKLVTPKSSTILPSITRRSLMIVAKDYLGMEVEERPVLMSEVKDFVECGLCGTAAVISPVGQIDNFGETITFGAGMEKAGPVLTKLYETLTGIQMETIEAPAGWVKTVL